MCRTSVRAASHQLPGWAVALAGWALGVSGTFSGARVTYLATDSDLGLILETFSRPAVAGQKRDATS